MDENEQEAGVTAESFGAIDTTNVDDECWMLRLPQKLAQVWETLPPGTELGDLVFRKGGTANGKKVAPSLSIEVLSSDPKLPKTYQLAAMTKKIPTLHPFVRHAKTGTIDVWGTVSRTANLQVSQESSQQYRALLQDRLEQFTVTNARFVQPVETTERVLSKSNVGFALKTVKRSLDEDPDGPSKKKARTSEWTDDQPLQSRLFTLFARQRYWTVKDLKTASEYPENEIRELLQQIAIYHRKGDAKNMWELRPEFQ